MNATSEGGSLPSRRALAYEHLEKGKLVFQRMAKFMSFRNVRAWEDLRQEISQRTLAFLLAGVVLAYGFSLTSPSIWINLPVALVLLLLLRRLSFNYEIRWSPDYHSDCCIHNRRPNVHPLSPIGPLLSFDLKKPSQTTSKRPETWRAGINSPAVEAAVDAFTKSIVKEWVTNLWYRLVTPDQDFPEELRLLINRAVAEIAVRIRRANLVNLLTRDLVDQFGHHLEVYRRAKDQIGPDVLDALSSFAQEERLRQTLLLQGELHVALTSPQAEYRVLRRLVGGVVTSALRPEEVQCSLLRVLAREIVAGAVMRPVMNLVNPALLNDLILSSIPVADKKSAKREDDSSASEERAKGEPSSRRTSRVHEEGLKSEAVEHKVRGPARPSFGSEDVEKFEKKKKALAAEHWDQMWVGAKGKKQRALAEARERRAREGGGSGHSSAGEDGKAFEWRKDVSPQGSSTTSLSALLEERGEDSSPWNNRVGSESSSNLRMGVHEAASNRPEPAVPGIGWEKDEWEDPVLDPTARAPSLTSTALEGAAASKSVHGDMSPVAHLKVSEISATPGHFIKDEKVKRFYTRGKVGLAKLDANWMGLDAAPSNPLPDGPPKSPLLSTRSEVIGSVSKFPPLSTRSEEGLGRDRLWEKERGFQSARTGSSSWNEALENATPKRRRRSLSGGLEALVSEETWGDDESQAHRRSSFEEHPGVSDFHREGGKLRRTSSEQLGGGEKESAPASSQSSGVPSPGGWNRVLGRVVGARMEESAGKAFAVYTIAVADSDRSSWLVQRRYRNFEALHRRLKDLPRYKLKLPPKRYLGPNLDGSFVLERRAQLDKYLQDLLAVPSVAESHEVWDFLSANSQAYGYGRSSSMIKTLAGNVDDVVDTMFRRLNEVSDELQGAITKGLKKAPTFTDTLTAGLSKQKPLPPKPGPVEVAMADQAYRGGEDEEAFVKVEETVSGGGNGKAAVKGRVWGWAPLPEGGELSADRSGEVIDRHQKIVGGDAHPRVESFPALEHASRRSGGRDSLVEEREGTLSRTDSGGVLEESEEEGEEIPLPQEGHASKLSGPLLNLVDNVFQLQQYGWLRRQVVWMARQILEIGLGDAIDDFILTKIKWLRQPEVVAAAIDGVRGLLWPNGVWFANQQEADTWQQQHPAASGGKPDGKTREVEMLRPVDVGREQIRSALRKNQPTRNVKRGDGSGRTDADGRGQPSVNSEGEIEWDWNPPRPQLTFEERLEAARKAALVRELFLDRAPAALVSLIGSKQYKRCARDVYNFLQSSVCVKQFTYSVLELLITTTFPELQALVHDVRTSGVTT